VPARPVERPERSSPRRPPGVPGPGLPGASMVTDYAALALLTAGTEPEGGDLVEVAAVRFRRSGAVDRFISLVGRERALPRRLQSFTGITAAELAAAPPAEEVGRALAAFVADAPVCGHGLGHDLAVLERHGLVLDGPAFDTAELGALLLPGLPDETLHGLARRLGVEPPAGPRALPRAEAVAGVFRALLARAEAVDALVLDEIVRLTAGTGWRPTDFFRDAAARARRTSSRRDAGPDGVPLDVAPRGADPGPALVANERRRPVTAEEVTAVFAAAAARPERFPGFEERPEQVAMARAVAETLGAGGRLVVEAATGVGKSLAYLVPAACFALRNNARVLVTTNTINLQEQITGKDVPELVALLEAGAPPDVRGRLAELRVAQLKGRRNYLCLQRLAALRRQGAQTEVEARFLTRVLLWLQGTETGDRAELSLPPDEEPLWARACAQDTTCFAGPSFYVRNGTCRLLQARRRAEAAHLVVANHALLLSDLAAGGRALPAYDYLVVDEAHNLEDEATNQFGFQAGQGHFSEYLDRLCLRAPGRETGLVADLHAALRLVPESHPAAHLHALAEVLAERVEHARARIPELFARVREFNGNHGEAGGEYDNRLLLTPAKRAQPEWAQVELAWENARLALLPVEDALVKLAVALAEVEGAAILDHDGLLAAVTAAAQTGLQLRKGVDEIVARNESDRIAWITTRRDTGAVTFSSAPLHVGEVLEDYLFGRKAAVVLTSATLSAGGSFRYIKERLGVEDAAELMLGSPFDYKRAALVLLPTDVPEPTHPAYPRAVEEAVVALCTASRGRALVLFTSHNALRATYPAVRRRLERAGVRVLGQGIDGTAKEILDMLRADPQTVLLGTSSFWEGVDVVGETLSLLVIAKLPFSVPTDPVFSARSALFEQPFVEYALPQAVLRFKQGFGRLIRHRTDRGVMVALDRRLRSKGYGRIFLESLPPCSIAQAPLAQLPALVERWLRGTAPPPSSLKVRATRR
jgi:predicted DnaQ family exonuclease/DinG family helicase